MQPNETPQQIIARAFGSYLVSGRRYHSRLPAALEPWYCYTADGGHSIAVVLASQITPGASPFDALVPAPIRAVLRAGWTERDGYIWCDLPYDADLGLVSDEEDDEY